MHFHDLDKTSEMFKNVFDIDVLSGMPNDDREIAKRMFHRRHVYEHNGGEVDQAYLDMSGDTSVRNVPSNSTPSS